MLRVLIVLIMICSACTPAAVPTPLTTQIAQAPPAPILVLPADGTLFAYIEPITLEWVWDTPLEDDQYFDVRIWQEGQPAYGITWTKETYYVLYDWLIEQYRTGTYYWQIGLVQGQEGQVTNFGTFSAIFSFTIDRYLTATPTQTPTPAPTATLSPLIQPVGAELNVFFEDEYRARSEAYQAQFAFDETTPPETLAAIGEKIRTDFMRWLGDPIHTNRIDDLSIQPLPPLAETYTLQAVAFTNANGLRIQGVLSIPTTNGPHPVMILPNGTAGSAAEMFGLTRSASAYRQVGQHFAPDYLVFAVEIPPTQLAAPNHFMENDISYFFSTAAGLNWEYYRSCDKVMSALDYIETLPQADLQRVGIYGLSYGGITAIMSALCDDRITAVAGSGTNVFTTTLTQITTHRRLVYAHQYIYDSAQMPDYYQVMYALFPRTVIAEINSYDQTGKYFEAVANVRRVQQYYTLRGAPQTAHLIHFADSHAPVHRLDVLRVKAVFDRLFLESSP